MAALLPRRALFLPPAIRTSIYQTSHLQSRRHASTITSFEVPAAASNTVSSSGNPVAEWIMTGPSYILDTMHSTGLPWWAVIPLSALIVRGGILYKYNILPARRKAILRRHLSPVISARMRRYLMHGRINRYSPLLNFVMGIQTMVTHGEHFKLRYFDGRALLNLGALVTMTETIRMKCGSRDGLLGLVTKPFNWLFSKPDAATVGEAAKVEPTLSPEEILAQRLFDAREAQQAAQSTTTSSAPDATDPQSLFETIRLPVEPLPPTRYADFIDPTLQSEPIFWLSDLTLPDPTGTLPFLLALTMICGVVLRSPPARTPMGPMNFVRPENSKHHPSLPQLPAVKKNDSLTNGQRLGIIFSFIFGAAATHFPAAVLLYLVPNMTIAWLQTRWMDVVYPMPGVVEPCRRPVRYKVRKEFEMPT